MLVTIKGTTYRLEKLIEANETELLKEVPKELINEVKPPAKKYFPAKKEESKKVEPKKEEGK